MQGGPIAEKKGYTETRAKQAVLRALRGKDGQLTRADVVALSGLPVPEAEQALTGLLKEYRSHLSATEKGELLYEFDPSFQRRNAEHLSEKLARLGRALWNGFTFLFKISILLTLAAYFLVFLAMMLALIFARRSGSRSDRDEGGFDVGWPLLWMWGWGPPISDPYGRPQRARGRDKPLYKKVFEFVFGPPHPQVDPLLDEKDILAYIRRHRGRIAAVDLVALMGWDFPQADEEATRLLIDYGGDPEVSDEGVVLFVFKDIRKTARDRGADTVELRSAWERIETRPALTGNSRATNVLISLFNGFNLFAPFWIVPAFQARMGVSLDHPFLLYTYPVLFSLMVFLVPLGRWLVENARDRGRRRRNAWRAIVRIAIEKRGAPLRPEELAQDRLTAKVVDRFLVALDGDVVTDDAGQMRYTFLRVQREIAAVARVRAHAPVTEEAPGDVVFSSKDPS